MSGSALRRANLEVELSPGMEAVMSEMRAVRDADIKRGMAVEAMLDVARRLAPLANRIPNEMEDNRVVDMRIPVTAGDLRALQRAVSTLDG